MAAARPLAQAGLAAALSMGDLGVISLFGTEDRETLPLLMSSPSAAVWVSMVAPFFCAQRAIVGAATKGSALPSVGQ